jgi:large subunit ribosomal protein L29
MATAAEIADFDTEELETRLGETRKELFNLRFQLATGQLDNFSRLGHVKKDVARMLTELRAREIAEAEGLAEAEIPAHIAAARQRSEDEALGRTRTTASERRAAARAEAEAAAAAAAEDEADDEDEAVAEADDADDAEATDAEATDEIVDATTDDDTASDDDDDEEKA